MYSIYKLQIYINTKIPKQRRKLFTQSELLRTSTSTNFWAAPKTKDFEHELGKSVARRSAIESHVYSNIGRWKPRSIGGQSLWNTARARSCKTQNWINFCAEAAGIMPRQLCRRLAVHWNPNRVQWPALELVPKQEFRTLRQLSRRSTSRPWPKAQKSSEIPPNTTQLYNSTCNCNWN